jgi:hypothetical protein
MIIKSGGGNGKPCPLALMNIANLQIVGIWILVANVGKIRAITMKDWNLAMEELRAPCISQCLCL